MPGAPSSVHVFSKNVSSTSWMIQCLPRDALLKKYTLKQYPRLEMLQQKQPTQSTKEVQTDPAEAHALQKTFSVD